MIIHSSKARTILNYSGSTLIKQEGSGLDFEITGGGGGGGVQGGLNFAAYSTLYSWLPPPSVVVPSLGVLFLLRKIV